MTTTRRAPVYLALGAMLFSACSLVAGEDTTLNTEDTVPVTSDSAAAAEEPSTTVDAGGELTASEVDEETDGDTADVGAMYAVSFGSTSQLWIVTSESDTLVGDVTREGVGIQLTDVELLGDGRLVGTSFTTMYLLDPATGDARLLGEIGFDGVNALGLGADGSLYAATLNGALLVIDTETGAGRRINVDEKQFTSSGDLTIGPGGTLYLTTAEADTDSLLQINPATGEILRTHTGFPSQIYGLVNGEESGEESLVGIVTNEGSSCATGALLTIDASVEDSETIDATSSVTEIRCLEFSPGGLATGAAS